MNNKNTDENESMIISRKKTKRIFNFIIGIVTITVSVIWFALGVTSLFRLNMFGKMPIVYWDSLGGIGSELAPWAILIGFILLLLMWKYISKFRVIKIGYICLSIGCFLLLISIFVSWNDGKRVHDSLQKDIKINYNMNVGNRAYAMAFPLKQDMKGLKRINDISYGPYGKDNTLDLIMPEIPKNKKMPILIQVHGGGMISGKKGIESVPLTLKMARAGWLVATINYRLAPENKWPAQIDDVNRAIEWIYKHAEEYGGDREFIAGVGGSAGGSLLSIVATNTSNPKGESFKNTQLKAVVSLYGAYDLLKSNLGTENWINNVLPKEEKNNQDLRAKVSPIHNIKDDTPPFYVVHGKLDGLVAVEEAREFVKELRNKSRNTVVYTELLGAHHGFDNQDSLRVEGLNEGIQNFLEYEYSKK